MRPLKLPTLEPASVVLACISGLTDSSLIARVTSIIPILCADARTYDDAARACTLHTIERVRQVDAVTAQELQKLYSDQMSATRGSARMIYNSIRNAPVNGKCPLCGIGNVTVLDHHLPKSKYPNLSVCPYNLVPACDFCNNAKRAKYPESASNQTIHPYYDDFTREQWICGRLDRSIMPAVVFEASPPASWSPIDQSRVRRHFEVVNLQIAYTSNANDELIVLRRYLAEISRAGGNSQVKAHLDGERQKHSSRVNSWQHILYQTLSSDEWFIGGGFEEIPQ